MNTISTRSRRPLRLRALALAAALAMIAAACGSGGTAGEGEGLPLVIVTTTILGDIVENIAGEDAVVEVIMPIGADPHTFEPSAQQAARLRDADLVIANGLMFEEGLLAAIESAEADGVRVLELGELLDPMPFTGDDDHDDGDDHVLRRGRPRRRRPTTTTTTTTATTTTATTTTTPTKVGSTRTSGWTRSG
jgi:ABC-type Zn uptake system ZnuABC Zn-binding protein ZnuA